MHAKGQASPDSHTILGTMVARYFLVPLTLNSLINFTGHQDDMPENIPSVFMPEK